MPEQIFNMAETSLFWKQMPTRAFILKEPKSMPGSKAFKGSSLAWGQCFRFTLKPFVIWHNENPRAFKRISKCTLPAHWEQ